MRLEQGLVFIYIPFLLYNSSFAIKSVNKTINSKLELLENTSNGKLSILTQGCAIPSLEFLDLNVREHPKYVDECHTLYPLLDNNQTHIWVVKNKIPNTNRAQGKLRCCYASATITTGIDGTKLTYNECTSFEDVVAVSDEFVRVTCDSLYEQFFVFPLKKPFTVQRENSFEISDNQNSFNILILGLSSMSRLNFHRTMPNTLKFLKSRGVIEMMGYSKVVEKNVLTNVLAMLVGMDESELKKTCWPSPMSSINRCPFIWERFKDIGYYTALLEDSAKFSVFNLNMHGYSGMNKRPTDYYLRPIINESERLKSNKHSHSCMGNKLYYKVMLDYLDNLTTKLKSDRLFTIYWESSMTCKNLNHAMIMDHDYENFIQKLDYSGYLNNTILILLSEQGYKLSEIYNTKQGRLEERLPSLFILLPPSFPIDFSMAYENLKQNSGRLITHYDIHDTLIDLVDVNVIKNEEVFLRNSIARDEKDKSISLFLEVPSNRTCKSAGIPRSICPCLQSKKLPKTHFLVKEGSEFVVQHLNAVLNPYPECAQLQLGRVLEASEQYVSFMAKEKTKEWQDIALLLSVKPGSGIFSATVRRRKDNTWSVVRDINRINYDSSIPNCGLDDKVKIFCHCLFHSIT